MSFTKYNLKFDWDKSRKVGILSGTYVNEIRNVFSVPNENAKFSKFQTGRYVQKRKHAITPTGRFDPCLYYEIRKYIKNLNYKVSINKTESFINQVYPRYNLKPSVELNLKLRDYQQEIVNNCISVGRGTVILATAGGKTLTIASLISNIYKAHQDKDTFKCLIIVPDLGLVNQTYGDFREYGVPFSYSKWTGKNELNLTSHIIIANAGILQSDKSNVDWTQHIDLLIVDEAHKCRSGNKINKIIKKIKTPHKFGFTGTIPDDPIDQWNIIGKIGPVVYEKNSADLRKEDYISQVSVHVLKINYNEGPPKVSTKFNPSKRYRQEIEFLSKSAHRNKVIGKLCNNLSNNTLILIDFIEHGEEIYNVLTNLLPDKQVYFIRGDVDVAAREEIKKKMEQEDNIICVAISKIFSTGISIKNLHYIIFAGGGKAKIKIIQSIGRGLRLHKNKKKMVLFDIADQLHYGTIHSEKRMDIYDSENIQYKITTI